MAAAPSQPVSLIPLMKGARHATLIGDHKQLPAVVTVSFSSSRTGRGSDADGAVRRYAVKGGPLRALAHQPL